MRTLLLLPLLVLVACSESGPGPADAPADRPSDSRAPVVDLTPVESRLPPRLDTAPCKLIKAYSSKNAVCNACAEGKCCAEVNGCLGDPECDDKYVICTIACAMPPVPDAGIPSCLQDCAKQYPKGKAEYDLAIGCAESKCATECK